MTQAQKFLFDECFEEGPPEDTLTLSQVEAIKQEAFNEGLSTHRTSTETQARQVLSLLAEKLVVMEQEKLKEITAQAATLTAAIMHKAFPIVASLSPLRDIEAFIQKTMDSFEIQNNCTIFVHPSLVLDVQKYVDDTKMDVIITVKGDESLSLMDCRGQWGEGGVERLQSYIYGQVIEMLSRLSGGDLSSEAALLPIIDTGETLSSDNIKDQVTEPDLSVTLDENNNVTLENPGTTEEAE